MLGCLARALPAPAEEAMEFLKTETQTYSNVVVTSKTATHIFITHRLGMAGLKVRSLEPAVRKQLGYQEQLAAPRRSGLIFAGEVMIPAQAREVERKLAQFIPRGHEEVIPRLLPLLAPIALGFHLLFSYCLMLICRKAGTVPGPAVWLPIVQVFPLLRAAKMSGWWFLLALLPMVNLLVFVRWSINMCQIRKKSQWLALFLVLPFTNFFALLYLAFSNGEPKEESSLPAPQFTYQR